MRSHCVVGPWLMTSPNVSPNLMCDLTQCVTLLNAQVYPVNYLPHPTWDRSPLGVM